MTSRENLKSKFELNDIPKEKDFADLIDDNLNKVDDTLDDIKAGATNIHFTAEDKVKLNSTSTQGEKGEKGEDGADGADGTNGINGTNGVDGIDGVDGEVGPQGPQGEPGIDGTNGVDGVDGVDGGGGGAIRLVGDRNLVSSNAGVGGNGDDAGTNNNNFLFGTDAGWSITAGFWNIFLGERAGYSNTTGGSNTFLGVNAGGSNTTGENNIFISSGRGTAHRNTTGSDNIFLGQFAGHNNQDGSDLVYLGRRAGFLNGEDGEDPADNIISIGASSVAEGSNTAIIGKSGTKTFVQTLNIKEIPTTNIGLETGDVWNDGGTLKII